MKLLKSKAFFNSFTRSGPQQKTTILQEGSLDPKLYMLKSQVKLCDITKRRFPMSFMIRFVNTTDTKSDNIATGPLKQNFVPNLTSNDKLH